MSFTEGDLNAIVGLFSLAGRLKTLKRQGWIDRGVDQPESVADHSWRVALMALVIGTEKDEIDVGRAITLALVHDLPEAVVGDITPFDDRLKQPGEDPAALFHETPEYSTDADRAKTDAERQAMHDLTTKLPAELQSMLIDAWEEYESNETPEANLVRQLDKLETWLQALEYHVQQPDLIIESFRRGTERDVYDDDLASLLRILSESDSFNR